MIQHGEYNNRIYLMELRDGDPVSLPDRLETFAVERGYGKIFVKLPETAHSPFLQSGFVREAAVPGMFCGETAGVFLGKFLKASRREEAADCLEQRKRVLAASLNYSPSVIPDCTVEKAAADDLEELAALYAEIFPTYPFPIQDQDFLKSEMESSTVYFIIRSGGKLMAASSYEFNSEYRYAEMTDFATRSAARGRGFASRLLVSMEADAAASGIRTAFTIARACSFGMNLVFSRAGYGFGGALVNNTMIGDSIETMHVWHKKLF